MSLADIQLPVVECFASIQGESTHAGRLCYFIRLAGCNLQCSYCDTVYAQSAGAGRMTGLAELLDGARRSKLKLVEITGGEPALHPATVDLAQILQELDILFQTKVLLLVQFPGPLANRQHHTKETFPLHFLKLHK